MSFVGSKSNNGEIFIGKIVDDSDVALSNALKVGDRVVTINGRDTTTLQFGLFYIARDIE